eukprot:scaffold144792_cov28-Tisochrysis_lutea.AAC.2
MREHTRSSLNMLNAPATSACRTAARLTLDGRKVRHLELGLTGLILAVGLNERESTCADGHHGLQGEMQGDEVMGRSHSAAMEWAAMEWAWGSQHAARAARGSPRGP